MARTSPSILDLWV